MKLSLHQPAYLPWLGYFEKIQNSDIFIYLDSVQLGGKKDNYSNRNKIKTSQGPQWLTIPIKGGASDVINSIKVDWTQNWQSKHLKSVQANYRKAPFYDQNYPKFEKLLSTEDVNFADICWNQLMFWMGEFSIKTKIVRASELNIQSHKSNLVLDICNQLSADYYLSGAQGKNYLNENEFIDSGIKIEYQQFIHPIYSQQWGRFEPCMGVIDYWMNCGSGMINFSSRMENYDV